MRVMFEIPYHREFTESTNKFEQKFKIGEGSLVKSKEKESSDNDQLSLMFNRSTESPVKAFCSGYYLLDNGEGHEKHGDDTHACWFIRSSSGSVSGNRENQSYLIVLARGENEFGRFISAGKLERIDGGLKYTLTLARRYVTDKDKRWKGTANLPQDTIRDLVERQIESTPWVGLTTKPLFKSRKNKGKSRKRNRSSSTDGGVSQK